MRLSVTTTLVLSCLLLAACPQGKAPRGIGGSSTPKSSGFVHHLPAELIEATAKGTAATALRLLESNAQGTRVFAHLRGSARIALWADFPVSPAPVKLELPGDLLCVDVENQLVYALDGNGGISRLNPSSPDATWEPLAALPMAPAERVLAADVNPAEGTLNVLAVEGGTPVQGETPTATSATAPTPESTSGATPEEGAVAAQAAEDSHSAAIPDLGGATARIYRLLEDGSYTLALETACGDVTVDGGPQLCCLADGTAALYIPQGQLLWLQPSDPAKPKTLTQLQELGPASLSADRTQAVAWLYAKPQCKSAGTGREGGVSLPGELVAIEVGGVQKLRYTVGAVPFSHCAGDLEKQSCLLAASSCGVAEVMLDPTRARKPEQPGLPQAELNWLLRHGGDTPLFLAAGGAQVWAALEDGWYSSSTEDLRASAPELAASQTLPKDDVKAVKAAVAALGWDFANVQVSPLAGFAGKLVLFDTESADASSAEVHWSAEDKRALNALVARVPTKSDLALLKSDPAAIEAQCKTMLAALGWTNPALDPAGVIADIAGASASFQLDATDSASGIFTLWLTDSSTLISLETAD